MSDLISRQAAIDALHMHLMYRMGTDSNKKRLDDWINSLPSAQGKPFNLPEIYIADGYDTIEGEDGNVGFGVYVPDENQIYVAGDVEGEIRARALLHEICHWVQAMCGRSFDEDEANEFSDIVYDALPSAQETHEERTETHACDCISRQAAIDAVNGMPDCPNGYSDTYDKRHIIAVLEDVPSVQPEEVDRDIATIIENEKDMRVILANGQTGWIPVTEELPEEDVEVLISYRYKEGEGDTSHTDIDITSYGQMYFGGNKVGNHKHWRAPFEYFESNYEVVAWMPLPPSYKEDEDARN